MSARRRGNNEKDESKDVLKNAAGNQKQKLDIAFDSIKKIFTKKEKEEKEKQYQETRKEKIKYLKEKLISKYNSINKVKFILVTLCIIIGIVAIYFITNYHLYGLTMFKDLSASDAIRYTTMTSNSIIKEYGEYILVIDKDTMRAVNKYGKEVWEKPLVESFTPKVAIAGKYIQLVNTATGRVYVYDSQYEVARIEIGEKISNAYINDRGISIIQYSVPGAKNTIGLYNASGKELKRITLDVENITNISLKDDRYLAYAYVDLSGISIITLCDVIDLKTNNITNIWTQNNAILYDMFWDKNNLYARLNNSVVVYNVKAGNLKEYDTYSLNPSFIDIDEDRIALLTITEDTDYNFSLMRYGKEAKIKTKFAETPLNFIYEDNMAYIFGKKNIYVYSKYGINVKNISLDLSISEWIVFNYGKSVCVISGNELLIFNI